MPRTSLSSTTKSILLGGGSAVLGGGCLMLLVKGGAWFALLWLAIGLASRDNDAPANQLTVVQGTVTNAETGRPIPGVLLSVRSYGRLNLANSARAADSGRTNALGGYRLRFRNQPGLYYRVCVDYPQSDTLYTPARYWFASPDDSVSEKELTLGRLNTFNFRPGERHTIAVRVHNRHTGYRFIQMPDGYELPISDRDTTLHLTYYALPTTGIKLNYLKHPASDELAEGDTAVALVLQNPAARFPDTVRATLTFVRYP